MIWCRFGRNIRRIVPQDRARPQHRAAQGGPGQGPPGRDWQESLNIFLPLAALSRYHCAWKMVYFSTATAPERRNVTEKNRVWDFFRLSNETHPAIRRQPAQPRRKIRPAAMKPVSGIPDWPSRDPIEEKGGINLYGFLGNDGEDKYDIYGCDYATDSFRTWSGHYSGESSGQVQKVQTSPKQYEFYVAHIPVRREGGPTENAAQRRQRKLSAESNLNHVALYYGTKDNAAYLFDGFAVRFPEFPSYGPLPKNVGELEILTRVTDNGNKLQWGDYADKPCNCVSDGMRINCLLASPNPPGGTADHKPGVNDCKTDIQHATKGCCLSGYVSAGTIIGTSDAEIELNYIADETKRESARDQLLSLKAQIANPHP